MNINTEQLKALLGSETAVQRFVHVFLEKLPEQMEALRQGLASGDWDAVSNTAHSLKSQFRYMGLNEAADLLQKIENEPSSEQATGWLLGVDCGY